MKLTRDTIKKFEDYLNFDESMKTKGQDILEIDDNTKRYLKNTLNIDF